MPYSWTNITNFEIDNIQLYGFLMIVQNYYMAGKYGLVYIEVFIFVY